MKIYLFRHGETKWNKEKKIQGCSDIELNDIGIIQAENLFNILKIVELNIFIQAD